METRFPISKEKGHVKLSFTWADAFRSAKKAEQASIHFEKAAVLFNLGAVLSMLGLQADRSSEQGVKDAARYFQVGGRELLRRQLLLEVIA
jgi:programmed cell death 6-interacting protein